MKFSEQRKAEQLSGDCPEWFTTAGYQVFKKNYAYKDETVKSRFSSIAKGCALYAPSTYPEWWEDDPYTKGLTWEQAFFKVLWFAHVVPPTPLYANGGVPERGHTVSCSQVYMGNNLYDRHNMLTELAILTKHAAGTSVSLDEWPAKGDLLKRGGRSEGVLPIIQDIIKVMNETAQTTRRGSCAYSLGVRHGDFEDVLANVYANPESNNVGWLYDDKEIQDCWVDKKHEAVSRFAKTLAVKLPRGKGYYTKIDHMNRHLAEPFKRAGLKANSSQLCQEIVLPSTKDYTYSCVLMNYNLAKWNEWKDSPVVFIGQVMSDCNVSAYLAALDNVSEEDKKALAKIKRFTEEFRALGSGVMGLATLFQQEHIAWDSLDAFYLNGKIFKHLDKQSLEASQWLAKTVGEPLGCEGLGIRNATRLSMPPTKSTAELCYGVSEGINPDVAHVFTKQTASGEVFRVTPEFLKLMKERGKYNQEELARINKAKGSVQGCDWLTEHEKNVFRTAFEINMKVVLNLAEQRQHSIDQAQSLNLYFASNATNQYIADVHKQFFLSGKLMTLYYIYGSRGDGVYADIVECSMCQ